MDFFKGLPEAAQKKLELKIQPTRIDPILVTLTTERFSREGWIFEPKLDGERCLAFRSYTPCSGAVKGKGLRPEPKHYCHSMRDIFQTDFANLRLIRSVAPFATIKNLKI
jgi:hypothetical protein